MSSPAPETAVRASDAPPLAPLHRLSSAYSMLASRRGRSILQVAFDCGFADISTFNRAFRKVYGATPSDIKFGRRGG